MIYLEEGLATALAHSQQDADRMYKHMLQFFDVQMITAFGILIGAFETLVDPKGVSITIGSLSSIWLGSGVDLAWISNLTPLLGS